MLVANPGADQYGSDRMLLESVSALVGAGWRTIVTVPGDGPLVAQIEQRGGRVALCRVPVLRRSDLRPPGLARLAVRTVRGVFLGVRLIRQTQPDAIYVNTVTIPLWLVLARLAGVPAICHVHEAEITAPAPLRKALALPLFLARHVIANSEFSRRVLMGEFRRLGGRMTVVLNGVEGPEHWSAARENLSGPVRLVYVGRLSARKGVDVAVAAVRDLADRGVVSELEVIGAVFPGYEWYEAQIRNQITSTGLSGRVRIRGFESDIFSRLAAADIALVPSREEPFGNTAIEAIMSARPVVVSAVPGLVEATSGFASARACTPGDPHALADAIHATIMSWADQRAAALQDASKASARHAPATYRAHIASAVDALVGAP